MKLQDQIKSLKKSMVSASNIYWNCDPKTHIKDETYTEVTQLLQV